MEDENLLTIDSSVSSGRGRRLLRFWGATLGFVCVIGIFSIFFWRVFAFYRGIQQGTINPALEYTTNSFTSGADAFASKALANLDTVPHVLGTNDASLGPSQAKVTIVEFGDFGCQYCQEVAPILRAIGVQHADDVRIVFRHFPVEQLHPGATLAAEGGGCAQEQGVFWEYYDLVYAESTGSFARDDILAFAEDAGADVEQFARCLDSGYYTKIIEQDIADGLALGVNGTPTFFFNGEKVEGSIPYGIFTQIVDAMLRS